MSLLNIYLNMYLSCEGYQLWVEYLFWHFIAHGETYFTSSLSLLFNYLIKFTKLQHESEWASEMLNGTYMQATVENEWLFESCSRHLRIFVDFDKEFLCKEKEKKMWRRKLWENYFLFFLRKAEKTNNAIKFHHNGASEEKKKKNKNIFGCNLKSLLKAFLLQVNFPANETKGKDKLYLKVHLRISGYHPNYIYLSWNCIQFSHFP